MNELYIVFFHNTPFFFNTVKEWADYENEWERIYNIEHLSLQGKKNLEIRLNGYKIEIYTYNIEHLSLQGKKYLEKRRENKNGNF